MQPKIKSGDRVIALVALARSSALIAGAVNGALLSWITERSVLLSGEALLGGALLGFVLGAIVGQMLFLAPSGQTAVVKAGKSSLALALKAAISGAILVSVAIALIIKTVISPTASTSLTMGIALPVGAVIGIVWGTFAALL